MNVLGIIPARGGSKGIPRKNIKILNGKPLMSYTVQSALESQLLSRVILSTDDPEIMAVGSDLGIEVPFERPSELAADNSPTLAVLLHAIEYFASREVFFDAVCILQLTSPFRRKGIIDEAIQLMMDQDSDSVISVLPVPHEFNPHWVFEPNNQGYLKIATGEEKIIPRRQELPASYYRDGGLYLTKTQVLTSQRSLYGSKVGYVLGDESTHVNLDTMADWAQAEDMASKLFPST
ncbi:cytidylyltransferase domain-containing protein [Algoriphagus namhaensis]|uniref:Cytidylyltransferase domain-containing protein n=1 Tax=Algoriphagus namhaensis TaxID=915353 RepID=A0ABV8ASG3_9BACT